MSSDAEDLVAFLHEKNKPEVCLQQCVLLAAINAVHRIAVVVGAAVAAAAAAAAVTICITLVASNSLASND
jgi:hypothetical protein